MGVALKAVNTMTISTRYFALALGVVISTSTQAQEAFFLDNNLSKEDLIPKLQFDVPSSSAFAVLGVAPENVQTPRKGSELAIGLLNGLDQQGNFQTGLAFEANPYFWTLPEKVQLDKYLNSNRYRLLSGLSVSIATSSGQEEADEADRIGLGINYAYEFDDPLYSADLNNCISGILDNTLVEYSSASRAIINDTGASDETRLTALEGLQERLAKLGDESVTACYTELVSWNRTALQFGLGFHNSELDGENPIDENGQSIWLSYSKGLGKSYQVIVHAAINDDMLIAQDNALLVTDNSYFGARVRIGSDKFKGFLEAGYTDEETDTSSDNFWKTSIGAEIALSGGLFLQLTYGDTFGTQQLTRTSTFQVSLSGRFHLRVF